MDGPRDFNTKCSNSKRERHISHDITYMWIVTYDTNEPIYKTETGSHRGQTGGSQGSRWLEEDWIMSLGLADANCYV